MAVAEIRPDWTIGALNLTAGVVEFTTTGSMLQTAAIQPGDEIITESGLVLIIASITGQNAGTLMEPCPVGAAGNGQPLRVRFQPDGSRYNGAAAELVKLLSSGNVYEFAGLEGVADGVPVFTGAGTMEIQAKSTFVTPDPNDNLADLAGLPSVDNLADLAGLTLAARQILQTDENGALKAIDLTANKALVTNASKDVELVDLGALGRALLALASGTTAQYVRADGTLQTLDKATVGLGSVQNLTPAQMPVSTAQQAALNGKLSTSGGNLSGNVNIMADWPGINLRGTSNTQGYLDFTPNGYSEDFTWRLTTAEARWDFVIEYGGGEGYSNGRKFKVTRNGDVQVFGNLSKSSGTFLIDHPKNPLNKNLRHGFVEAPEYLNIYRGVVDLEDGQMSVDIDAAFGMSDGTFAALNVEVCAFLQTQYCPERVWLEGPADSGKFTIISENPQSSAAVAFMVTGRRNDPYVVHLDANCERGTGRFIPEFDKPLEGKFSYAYGNKTDY